MWPCKADGSDEQVHAVLLLGEDMSTRARTVDFAALARRMASGIGFPIGFLRWMRLVQMAAIHLATMRTAAKLGSVKNPQLADQHERAMNRLARTFAAQVEAMKRYRSKGEQRVYVERVTVNEGGQAIVGPVTHAGRGGASEEIDG